MIKKHAQSFTAEERRAYIGASDCPVLMGLSPFKSPVELMLEKRGELAPEAAGERAHWGKYLEEAIAERAAEVHGIRFRRWEKAYKHPQMPYFQAHLDRIAQGRKNLALECKSIKKQSWFNTWQRGEHGISNFVYCQLQAQFACKPSLQSILLAVAIVDGGANDSFHTMFVSPDPLYIADLEKNVKFFWEECVHGVQRPPHARLEDFAYEDPKTDEVEANAEVYQMLSALKRINRHKGEMDEMEKAIKERLAHTIDGSETVVNEMGRKVLTFKESTRNSFDSKRFQQDHPDLFAMYATEKKYRTMRPFFDNVPEDGDSSFVQHENDLETISQMIN